MKAKDRQSIYDKYGGHCAYCGCELKDKWQVDHIISKHYWKYTFPEDVKGMDNIQNLMPTCCECNHYKRSLCIEDGRNTIGFRTYMLNFHKRLSKIPKKTIVTRTQKRKIYMQIIADKYNITPPRETFYRNILF